MAALLKAAGSYWYCAINTSVLHGFRKSVSLLPGATSITTFPPTSPLAIGQGAFRSWVEMANYRIQWNPNMSSLSPPKGVLQMLSVWRSPSYKVRHIRKIGYNSINIITKVPINGAQKATVAVQYITKNVVSVCVCGCAEEHMYSWKTLSVQFSVHRSH